MRAVTVSEYGGTPAVAEIPTPEPGARQMLIRLRAAGMNPMDLWLTDLKIRRRDLKELLPLQEPAVLGFETAGVVDASAAN